MTDDTSSGTLINDEWRSDFVQALERERLRIFGALGVPNEDLAAPPGGYGSLWTQATPSLPAIIKSVRDARFEFILTISNASWYLIQLVDNLLSGLWEFPNPGLDGTLSPFKDIDVSMKRPIGPALESFHAGFERIRNLLMPLSYEGLAQERFLPDTVDNAEANFSDLLGPISSSITSIEELEAGDAATTRDGASGASDGSRTISAMGFRRLNVLIASPGDATPAGDAIEKALHVWNSQRSNAANIILLPRRWKTDSVPLLDGGDAQSVINSQLVDESHIVFAVFYHRLGSPTPRAVSATAEEIRRSVDAGKPVHLYFVEKSAPYDVDLDQFKALREFRREIQQIGLVGTFSDESELHELVTRAIERHISNIPPQNP